MPRYDVRCVRCGAVRHDVWFSSYKDAVGHAMIELSPCCSIPADPEAYAGLCRSTTFERLPSAPNFVINGYSAKNGYSK